MRSGAEDEATQRGPSRPSRNSTTPGVGLSSLANSFFVRGQSFVLQLLRRHALDRLFNNGKNVGPGVADAFRPDFVRRRGAELGEQALVGAHRQDFAVDQHAVAIENEQVQPMGKFHISVTPWLASDAAHIHGRPPSHMAQRRDRQALTRVTFSGRRPT